MATLAEIKDNCEQTFRKRRDRTLKRYKFFSRKQRNNETLRHFWNALTGLAARCDFEQHTESLVMDAFIQKIHNKTGMFVYGTKRNSTTSITNCGSFQRRHQPAETFRGGTKFKRDQCTQAITKADIHARDAAWNS